MIISHYKAPNGALFLSSQIKTHPELLQKKIEFHV